MSRYDREDLAHLDLPDPSNVTAVYYIEGGESIEKEAYLKLKVKPTICAKAVTNIESGVRHFHVLCNNRNQLFDPNETDSRYIIRNRWKFIKASRTAFDIYIKFLQQKYRSLLQQAERSL